MTNAAPVSFSTDKTDINFYQGHQSDEDDNVNVDNTDDEFEEYEWAGQKRIRASSMLRRDSPTGN